MPSIPDSTGKTFPRFRNPDIPYIEEVAGDAAVNFDCICLLSQLFATTTAFTRESARNPRAARVHRDTGDRDARSVS